MSLNYLPRVAALFCEVLFKKCDCVRFLFKCVDIEVLHSESTDLNTSSANRAAQFLLQIIPQMKRERQLSPSE